MIALVAHDRRKSDLLDWVRSNHCAVARHGLVGTSSTARMLRSELGLRIRSVESGPHGGDQQIEDGFALEGQADERVAAPARSR